MFKTLTKLSILIMILQSCSQMNPRQSNIVELNSYATLVDNGDGFFYAPGSIDEELVIWDQEIDPELENFKYLVLDVNHESDFSVIVYINFYATGEGTHIIEQGSDESSESDIEEKSIIHAKIGVMPMLPTQVILPLSHVDGQHIFIRRFYRQLKGTVLGQRLNPKDVRQIRVRLAPFQEDDYLPSLNISRIYLSNETPKPIKDNHPAIVDQFGQWKSREWPGKTQTFEELSERLNTQLEQSGQASFPEEWSKYGGWKEKQFEATGFFRTHHDGNRWWLVDPQGYAFISTGIDVIRPTIQGAINGTDPLFEALPSASDHDFGEFWGKSRNTNVYNFLGANFKKVFGNSWREKWDKITHSQLLDMRVNTIANWSDPDFTQTAKLPYVIPMRNFPVSSVRIFRDFPDIFDPEYQQALESYGEQLEPFKDDPYLIGYFLKNEPHWAFGAHNIAMEMFRTPEQSYSKNEFIRWISNQYNGDASKFGEAWNISVNDFNDLTTWTISGSPNEIAYDDFFAFSRILVRKLITDAAQHTRKWAPNHLNLGMRYAWISSDLCYEGGDQFDVFSINGYSYPEPPPTSAIAQRTGKPVLIGEFHFGAIDRGLPANGIQGVTSQQERARAYRHYIENGFARPEIVALHYFQYYDLPVLGRHDGENYQIGFYDIGNNPYTELVDMAKKSHEHIYQVAAGIIKPYRELAKRAPQIFF